MSPPNMLTAPPTSVAISAERPPVIRAKSSELVSTAYTAAGLASIVTS
jgi:hypothetical protein